MPGAPNKPPDSEAPPAPTSPLPEDKMQHAIRRLAPDRLVLRLSIWRGAPNVDLIKPLERVAATLAAGEFPDAEKALDQFSVRLAEPRWPTIPEPWIRLRVAIPAPQPPHWNPDFTLTPADRDAKKDREWAHVQLLLAKGAVELAPSLSVDLTDVQSCVAEAQAIFDHEGATAAFWAPLDRLWNAVQNRVPLPSPAAVRAAPPAKLPPGIEPEEA
ncbi:MAG: hypothetical protein WA688_00025 [Thermoplasmata archaeon]